ncbi:MAG: Holliday junction resolvase RuvX [Planctomycetales bacterium]|nr:Holliday junction resolvase RuvX [Planctomycetales bacterium]
MSEPQQTLPSIGRLAGLDYGSARIGIAICDPSQTWISPLETYSRRNAKLDGEFFGRLVEEEALVGFVVGLPIHCDGKESQKSAEARSFGTWLTDLTGLPVVLFDERFTTSEARQLLAQHAGSGKKKRKKLDGLAAHLILSHFLDSSRQQLSQNDALDR